MVCLLPSLLNVTNEISSDDTTDNQIEMDSMADELVTENEDSQALISENGEINGNCNGMVLDSRKPEQPQSFKELIYLAARFALILSYFFLCDRTNFFMKGELIRANCATNKCLTLVLENKYYTRPNFFLPIAYVFALGLFFTEESKHTHLLHRDQTDEWKGWMQLVILTYHMTGASQVLVIYNHMRLLVSAYLFLSGFGHFSYFWLKGHHGVRRLWQVSGNRFGYRLSQVLQARVASKLSVLFHHLVETWN